ncbi:excinuclease ABC subunit UvrC [archaeon]|nr:excinuclease ABC subunit UvrC [archaeon]
MLLEILKNLPSNSGVYLMKDKDDKIIYIGKAKNLKKRVKSYFDKTAKGIKVSVMASHVKNIEFMITDSEIEALVLENSMIKKIKPKYNIDLKDDKAYPYIRVTLEDEYPRVLLARRVSYKKGSKYFGPYTSSVLSLIRTINATFKIRDCPGNPAKLPKRKPCLLYELGRCFAPCSGEITKKEYDLLVLDALNFLEGKSDTLIDVLSTRMKNASSNHLFERAAMFRDQIKKIDAFRSRQKIVSAADKNRDVIGYFADSDKINISIFFVRGGVVTGNKNYVFDLKESTVDVLTSFVKQFYSGQKSMPNEIIIAENIDDVNAIEQWLFDIYDKKIKIKVPKKGELKKLVDMVSKNACISLEQYKIKHVKVNSALLQLQDKLGLSTMPKRIEAFDISTIQGTNSVGSMVVFIDGHPANREYRKFKIKTVKGQDDFSMMKEVIKRRYTRVLKEGLTKPDLILVDGGKGQLGVALEVLDELNLSIPLCSLAKREEEIFLPEREHPVILDRESQGLYLMQRIRDEAHRFAVTYHRKLRSKGLFGG